MPVFIGGIDPLKLIESLLNILVRKGFLTQEEAQEIINSAKAPGQ